MKKLFYLCSGKSSAGVRYKITWICIFKKKLLLCNSSFLGLQIAFKVWVPPPPTGLAYFAPCKEIQISKSGKSLLVESGILGFAIRDTSQGFRNPTKDRNDKDWNSECLEYGTHAMESRYPRLSWIPLHGETYWERPLQSFSAVIWLRDLFYQDNRGDKTWPRG